MCVQKPMVDISDSDMAVQEELRVQERSW
ncbi:hypothetical protein Goari_009920 [Gossypium aridum]|uniref:Uncharacterized protein n=1 Tax=Gossypium aridum TaxID=34290 RepID=A0A7J8Y012_GOSAI|nr:hypothetical protein [Gossypium aridum]